MIKKKYTVTGMTCASCQMHVQNAVSSLNGVISCQVNLLSNSMNVSFDEEKVTEEDMKKAVADSGYQMLPYQKDFVKRKEQMNKNIKNMQKRLILSFIFFVPLFYISMGHMIGLPLPKFMLGTNDYRALIFSGSQLILVIPIIIINFHYFKNGYKQLFKRSPNMDTLIAIGATASLLYGIFAFVQMMRGLIIHDYDLIERYHMDLYFESSGTILTLVTLGKFLETKSKGKTSATLEKLMNLAPKTALLETNNGVIEINSEDVKVKDILQVKPGMSIPVDGIIIFGETAVDESMISGESLPKDKVVGDFVVGATINKTGFIRMEVTRVGEDTTLSQIVNLVDEASNSKAPISKLADKISGIFVPIVMIIAIITFIIQFIILKDFELAMSMGISVLVISCPCALGLATPVAIMVGTGKGAELGILIKSSEALEQLGKVNCIVLDKTGTITKGSLVVTNVYATNSLESLLHAAYILENKSEHPLAKAIIQYIETNQIKINKESINGTFQSYTGFGVEIKENNNCFIGGNKALLKQRGIDLSMVIDDVNKLSNEGKTVIYFARNEELLGYIALRDEIKENSKEAIQNLKKMNLEVIMATGDNNITAMAYQKELGIEKVLSEVTPMEKESCIKSLQDEKKIVAMVGDGINDAIALAKSDVAIAIGAGTDIAIESADIVLMKNSLMDVVYAIQLSKAVMRNIKMNLFWAFFYNSIGIPIAAGVFYLAFNLKLNPMIASLAMSFSSVCVVLNALRLRFFHTKNKIKEEECNEKSINN